MAEAATEVRERRRIYLALSGLFLAAFAAFTGRGSSEAVGRPGPFEFLLMALATFRASRLVACDKIFSGERSPFTRTAPGISGTGKTTVPRGRGPRQAIGELIACPVCNGTWIAAALLYGRWRLPGPTRALITVFAAAGANELLGVATEALQWTGEAERRRTTLERKAGAVPATAGSSDGQHARA
jgi:hypothetical protein